MLARPWQAPCIHLWEAGATQAAIAAVPIEKDIPMPPPHRRPPPHRHRCPVCGCQWDHRAQRCHQHPTRICPPCQHSQGSNLLDMPRARAPHEED
jgi:hypothetical protein